MNPLAVAHRVNHPPPGTAPNLLNAAVEFSPALQSSAPNLWFDHLRTAKLEDQQQPPAAGRRRRVHPGTDTVKEQDKSSLRGLAMVSIAPLRDGDELFVAYRFNPKHPTPVRQHPVSAALRRACQRACPPTQCSQLACWYVVVLTCCMLNCLSTGTTMLTQRSRRGAGHRCLPEARTRAPASYGEAIQHEARAAKLLDDRAVRSVRHPRGLVHEKSTKHGRKSRLLPLWFSVHTSAAKQQSFGHGRSTSAQ